MKTTLRFAALLLLCLLPALALADAAQVARFLMEAQGETAVGTSGPVNDAISITTEDGTQYWYVICGEGFWLDGFSKSAQGEWERARSGAAMYGHSDLYLAPHDASAARPNGLPWPSMEGFDVVSRGCGCTVSYRYDGESFIPAAWFSPCNFSGRILYEDERLIYYEDGGASPTDEVDMTDGYSVVFADVDSIPPTPEDARRIAKLMRRNVESLFPGYTLRSYVTYSDFTEAQASYARVEEGVLYVRRMVGYKDSAPQITDCMPVPLSPALIARLESEPFEELLSTSGDSDLFLTEDTVDISRIPVSGRVVSSDLQADALILLTQEETGARRLHVVSMETDGGCRLESTDALPEDTHMDVFHTGDGHISLYWAEQYAGVGFTRHADGVWRLSGFHNEMDANNANCALRYCGFIDYDNWTPGQTDCITVGSLGGSGLAGFDFTTLPETQAEAYARLDRSGWAKVNNPNPADRLHLRTGPKRGAASLGKFYNGTPVEVLEREGDWCRVRIGLDGRLTGWMMAQYLAFGEEMDSVDCVFPQLGIREEYASRGVYDSKALEETVQLSGEMWIAGVVGEELYVLVTDKGETGYAPQDWFWEGNG